MRNVKNPIISVLMPIYNPGIESVIAINSILGQSIKDIELVIIDDGSLKYHKGFHKILRDPRIIYKKLPHNVGCGAALNHGLSICKAEFIARADGDDISEPSRLEMQLDYLIKNPDITVAKCKVSFFADMNDRELKKRVDLLKNSKEKIINNLLTHEDIANSLKDWCCIPHTTTFYRRHRIMDFGYQPLRLWEDYLLWLTALRSGLKFGHTDATSVSMRVSKSSATATIVNKKEPVHALCNFKSGQIKAVLNMQKKAIVVGNGEFGKEVACYLNEMFGINATNINIEDLHKLLADSSMLDLKIPFFLACQPVREEASAALETKNLHKNKDYMILA